MAVTINDIAEIAKVSPSTVSRFLNDSGYVKEETKARIKAAIEKTKYTPSAIARSLSKSETSTIGVIVPDITNSYFGEVIKGISCVAEKNNLNIIFYNTDNCFDKEIKAINVLEEQRIKGIILTPGFGAENFNDIYADILNNLSCPLILVCADVKSIKLNGVFVDNIKGAFEATKLLIEEGHEKIGIMLASLSSEPMSQRLIGYKKALSLNNIEANDKYIYISDFSLEKSYELTKEMLNEDDRPTALIVCSNRMTMGVIKAIEEENKSIPNDLAIIGCDKNELLDMFGMNITYLEECPVKLGESAMEMLCGIINTENKNQVIRKVIAPKIIVKGSEKKVQ